MKPIIFYFSLLLSTQYVTAQTIEPVSLEVGMPMPDFILKEVFYYEKNTVSNEDFKGKWLVLDMFSSGCVACFKSFPKINEFQKDFGDRVQFLLVGRDDNYIRQTYEKFKDRMSLTLPVAYDTLLFKQFQVAEVPYIIVADDQGIIKAITPSLTHENITDLLDGKTAEIRPAVNREQKEVRQEKYDSRKPLLLYGNGGEDSVFLYRSVLAKWNGLMTPQQNYISASAYGNSVQVVGLPLTSLYMLAYGDTTNFFHTALAYGNLWPKPILELTDSSEFIYDKNYVIHDNLYSYSLIVPQEKATTSYIRKVMQRELDNYFGYSVDIEYRMMPYWGLRVSNNAQKNLVSKSTVKEIKAHTGNNWGAIYKNAPVSDLISELEYQNYQSPPFIDETGIEGNIDLVLDADLTNFDDFRAALKKAGIELVRGEKLMKVIAIRDPKQENTNLAVQ